jgi:hypothetical protein
MRKYISRKSDGNLEKFMAALNRTAAEEGLEDAKELGRDSMVTEINIHYPANSSLAYGCVKGSGRLREHLKEEINGLGYGEYRAKAKRVYFETNGEKRVKLFKKQMKLFIRIDKLCFCVILMS